MQSQSKADRVVFNLAMGLVCLVVFLLDRSFISAAYAVDDYFLEGLSVGISLVSFCGMVLYAVRFLLSLLRRS